MKIKARFGETITCGADDSGGFFLRVDRDDLSPIGVLEKRGVLALKAEINAYLRTLATPSTQGEG